MGFCFQEAHQRQLQVILASADKFPTVFGKGVHNK